MKNENTAHDLILGKFIYRLLESAKLIPQDDFKKYFNPKGIKFPTEFNTKSARAQLESVKEYISSNGLRDLDFWLQDSLNEAQKYRALKQHYINIFTEQLKGIHFRK